ncbi:MAG: class I SAM-dependent methyltransferase [Actinomycetota bacterium]
MEDDQPLGLEDAYAVETPEDNRRLYASWAATYDADFIAANDYRYHMEVASVLVAGGLPIGPVLDVGCGTGQVGEALRERGVEVIDGADISPEMLARADHRQIYRRLIEVDLTQPVPIEDATYAAIVSAGVFTHGHLPPEPLDELIRILAPGGRAAIGINSAHFVEFDFGGWLDRAAADGRIAPYEATLVPVYDTSNPANPDAMAQVVAFTVLDASD